MIREDITTINNGNWYAWTFLILSGLALGLGMFNFLVFLTFGISAFICWFSHLIHQDQAQLRQQARDLLKTQGKTWHDVSFSQQSMLLNQLMAKSNRSLWIEMVNVLCSLILLWGLVLWVMVLDNFQLSMSDWLMVGPFLVLGILPLRLVIIDIKYLRQNHRTKQN